MRGAALLLVVTLTTACGGTSHSDFSAPQPVTAGSSGESTVYDGGEPPGVAGAAGVAGAGGSGGSGQTEAGTGGMTVGGSPGAGAGGAAGGVVSHGGEPNVGGSDTAPMGGQAGAPVTDGGAGGADVDPGPDPLPWKVCDTDTCADDEVCAHETPTKRVCVKIGQFNQCVPHKPDGLPDWVQACCASKPIACSTLYSKCGMMDDPATGNGCGVCDHVTYGRWHCGPPAE